MKGLLIPHKPSRRLLLPKVTGKPEPDELKRHGYGVLLSTPQGLEMGTGPETWEKTGSGGGGGEPPRCPPRVEEEDSSKSLTRASVHV